MARWTPLVPGVLILPLLVPLGLGLSILLGGPAPTVDTSVIAVLIFRLLDLSRECGRGGARLARIRSAASAGQPQRPDRGSRSRAALGIVALAALADRQRVHPLIMFPAFVLSTIALSVLLTWIYNSTGGSLLLVVLLHATANLPITVLLGPLGIDALQPYLIFTALLIIARALSSGLRPSNLSAPSESKPPITSQTASDSRCPRPDLLPGALHDPRYPSGTASDRPYSSGIRCSRTEASTSRRREFDAHATTIAAGPRLPKTQPPGPHL